MWLDPERTTPYAFYQYWVQADDRDVGTYLRWFTELSRERIEALDAEVVAHPEQRAAQRELAMDVTTRVHGEAEAAAAVRVSEALFQREPITDPGLLAGVHLATRGPTVAAVGDGVAVLLADTGLAPSRGEARRLIQGGAITVNGERIGDPAAALPAPIGGEWFEVRVGKRQRAVVRLRPG